MKKGFLVSSIALVLSSSFSNTVFAFPFTSFVIEPIVAISDTLSAIPPKPLRMTNAADMNERVKEDIIEPYERDRLKKLFGYDHRGSTLENHLFNEFNGMSTKDRDELYRELEPKMSDINKSIDQSKLDTINQLYEESQYLENKISLGDEITLDESKKYTNKANKKILEKSKKYADTINQITLEESKGYTDSVATDLRKNIHQQHDSAIDTSKKYTDQVSDKNNKANHAKFKQLESMHAKAQAQNATHFSQMDKKISKTAKQANAGIASVSAMSNIPYAMNTRFSLGAGLGNYRNGTAVAVGAQYQIKENVNLRSSVSWNNSDSAVVGAGVAIGW